MPGIRPDQRVREAQHLLEQEAFPIRHGLATFVAFVIAGAVPLVPYAFSTAAAGCRRLHPPAMAFQIDSL
jgi:VIT1/CCC1 family predicted Fe2+/Mn2+ transporter